MVFMLFYLPIEVKRESAWWHWMPGVGLREHWHWRGKGEWVNFFLCSYESFDLLQYWDYVTAVEPSRKTTLKEENWGTAEGKEKREIIMESWVLPRRQVLDLRGQSSQQPKRVVWDQYTPNMADRVRWRGRNKKGTFTRDQAQDQTSERAGCRT